MAKKKSTKASANSAAGNPTAKKRVKKSAETDAAKEPSDALAKKAKPKRKKKAVAEVRLKVYWGVFNHALKRVALYDFNQRKAAEKRAAELTEAGKPPFFVMKVKEQVTPTK